MSSAAVKQGLLAKVKNGLILEHDGAAIGFLVFGRNGVDALKINGEHIGKWNTGAAAAAALIELASPHASRCVDAG